MFQLQLWWLCWEINKLNVKRVELYLRVNNWDIQIGYVITLAKAGPKNSVGCKSSFPFHPSPPLPIQFLLFFSARCNIPVYISRLCYDVSVRLSVRLSVTEVHWRIMAYLGFKFQSKFTAHCGRMTTMCPHALRVAVCWRIVVAVHTGKRGRVISRYASHC